MVIRLMKRFHELSRALLGGGSPDYGSKGSLPSGVAAIDSTSGFQGLPRASLVHCVGDLFMTRRLFAFSSFLAAADSGRGSAYIDFEGALACHCAGHQTKGPCIVMRPQSAQEAVCGALELAKSKSLDLVVIDSMEYLISQRELGIPLGQNWIFAAKTYIESTLWKLLRAARQTGTTFVLLSQSAGSQFGLDLEVFSALSVELMQSAQCCKLPTPQRSSGWCAKITNPRSTKRIHSICFQR